MSKVDSLIARFRGGDEAAFAVLFEAQVSRLQTRIRRRLAPLVRRKVSIQDVLQEVRIAAFTHRERFVGSSNVDFERWVAGIAERKVHKAVRWYAGTRRRSLDQEISRPDRQETANGLSPAPSPSQDAIAEETRSQVLKALGSLPEDYRSALRLVREEGLSLRQVGQRMGRSYDAAKQLHARAMVRFTQVFESLREGTHGET